MTRPVFLRNLTHRILWVVAPTGTLGLGVYWLVMRDPSTDWRVFILALLLAIALGWWPVVASSVGALLALLCWIIAPEAGVSGAQLGQEVLSFSALGLGWGLLLRSLLPSSQQHARPTSAQRAEPPLPSPAVRVAEVHRPIPHPGGNAPVAGVASGVSPNPSSPVRHPPPPPPPPPPPLAQASAPDVGAAPKEQTPDGSSYAGFALPKLGGPDDPPRPLPQRPPSAPTPAMAPITTDLSSLITPEPAPVPVVPFAAPLMTQEVDLGDFRSFVAMQQTHSSAAAQDELPVNRIAKGEEHVPLVPAQQQSSAGVSGHDEHSSTVAPDIGHRRSQAISRPETVPGSPYETILEWYNQFSWAPWQPDELERRYHRLGQKVGWDVLALQDLVRAWKVWREGPHPAAVAQGHTNLHDLEGFLRCEMLGVLRAGGHPDLNLLSKEDRSEAWMAVYKETRGRVRGGSPLLRPMPDTLVSVDPTLALSGRPDALVEIGGECDVVAFVTPMSPSETMSWTGVFAEAQRVLASRLGVVVTETPIVVTQCMPYWDERRQPRLTEVQDRATENRRLGVALERFRRVLDKTQAPRPQTHGSVCNGCGVRHFCKSYSGTRPRLDLASPPPILQKFLQ